MGSFYFGKNNSLLAGERGFEPPLYGPEPHVLPLDDSPAKSINMLTENH